VKVFILSIVVLRRHGFLNVTVVAPG